MFNAQPQCGEAPAKARRVEMDRLGVDFLRRVPNRQTRTSIVRHMQVNPIELILQKTPLFSISAFTITLTSDIPVHSP